MDAHTAAIVARCFPESARTLTIGGIPATELVEQFGSPIYVYDAGLMRASWARLQAALPPSFDVCYSVKANPHPRVLRLFVSSGARLEIASAGELDAALAAGCEPRRVLFAGPGKSMAELEQAVRAGIGEIHVESRTEIGRVSRIASEIGVVARVAVRVNPGSEARGGAMQMGGKPAPFGIDEELLDEVVDAIEADAALHLTGIHLFSGTQILDHEVLLAQYTKGLELAVEVSDRIGRPVEVLDFGGGLGIPYFVGETPLDLDALRAGVVDRLAAVGHAAALAETQLLVEPGRYLVGEAGVYLTRVNDVKTSRGKTFVIVDGGMHHHLAASGNLGQVIKRNYPVVAASRLDEPDGAPVDVVGPLCTPLDILARNLALPAVQIGDVVAVLQSGAYGRSASPLGFLSRPAPAEIWVEDAAATPA